MSFIGSVLRQWRRPTGRLGRLLARAMNVTHSPLADWGLKHVSIGRSDTILDVGCGGGGTVRKLAQIASDGKVYGVDLSEDSVDVARRTNERLMEAGRVQMRCASVSSLPFDDDTFDLVTAVNTHYYWPDLPSDLREILRVLKPGGRLVLVGGAHGGQKHSDRSRRFLEAIGVTTYHSPEELRDLLSTAGYSKVEMFERYRWGYICGVSTKPNPPVH